LKSFVLEIIHLLPELLHGYIPCKAFVSEKRMITEHKDLLICSMGAIQHNQGE
jgi:hypothetical protein